MYHYTYYSYEEFGRGYIGKRSCKCSPEEDVKYFGSYKDKTFKPTQKIILETYDTATEAIADEIKVQRFFKVVENPHFVNKVYQTSTKFQGTSETARKGKANMTPEQRSAAVRKGNAKFTAEQRSAIRKKGRMKQLANMTPEQRSAAVRKGKANMTPEQRTLIAKKANAKLTTEQRSAAGRKAASQKFQCTVTGFITNAGNLSQYQRARGIDTSNRVRLS